MNQLSRNGIKRESTTNLRFKGNQREPFGENKSFELTVVPKRWFVDKGWREINLAEENDRQCSRY